MLDCWGPAISIVAEDRRRVVVAVGDGRGQCNAEARASPTRLRNCVESKLLRSAPWSIAMYWSTTSWPPRRLPALVQRNADRDQAVRIGADAAYDLGVADLEQVDRVVGVGSWFGSVTFNVVAMPPLSVSLAPESANE